MGCLEYTGRYGAPGAEIFDLQIANRQHLRRARKL
jgi:hypothetical protein